MEIMLIALRLAKGNPSNLILCYSTTDTGSDFTLHTLFTCDVNSSQRDVLTRHNAKGILKQTHQTLSMVWIHRALGDR